jgi:predicted GNAT superfamily acetyltransferase
MPTRGNRTKTTLMTIATRPLQTVEDFRAAVALQQTVVGERASTIWQVPHLLHVQRSGGLLLGAFGSSAQPSESLHGILIDLIAKVDDYPAHRTVAWGVSQSQRNRGIGTRLRVIERRTLQQRGIDITCWDVDPLNSSEIHIALNKLGGILTGYSQNDLGSNLDARAPGLATDSIHCEWWLDAPRVASVLDQGHALPHQQIGLHEMTVLTKTTVLPSGARGIVEWEQSPASDHVLAEIPENLADLQVRDHDAAIQWRLRSRGFMERLFQLGYLGVGLIHEGGRSFLLFKKGTRRTELGAADKR